MDRKFIDRPLFQFSEVLELTKLGRGTVEGYIKRGIVKLTPAETSGRGHHRGYTGRDILKIAAVAFMSKAGIPPGWVSDVVADEVPSRVDPKTGKVIETRPGKLVGLIDEYISAGPVEAFRKHPALMFNVVEFSGGLDFRGLENPGMVSHDEIGRVAGAMRARNAISYATFDAPLFVWYGFQLLQGYIKERTAKESL